MNLGTTIVKSKLTTYIALHIMLVIFSLNAIFSKLAANEEFLSFKWCLYYVLVIVFLGIYAIGWQQVIKRLPLTTAYANRAVTVVWGLVFGCIIFGEKVTIWKITGIALVIAGVILFAFADSENSQSDKDSEIVNGTDAITDAITDKEAK